MDEALTAYETHSSFGGMLGTVAHVETTPPLYFVLIWAWAHVFGSGEVGLRSLSTLAGIALVPIAFVSARELFSRWAGVLAAAFVAVNPFLVWYSQEARSYMLLAALSGASFLWFNRARERSDRTKPRVVDGVLVASGDDALLRGVPRRPRSVVAAVGVAPPRGGRLRRDRGGGPGRDAPAGARGHRTRYELDRPRAQDEPPLDDGRRMVGQPAKPAGVGPRRVSPPAPPSWR